MQQSLESKVIFAASALVLSLGAGADVAFAGREWRLSPECRIDGNILTVTVPKDKAGGIHATRTTVDLESFENRGFEASIRVCGKDVSVPPMPYNGVKVMFHYRDKLDGSGQWPGAKLPTGSFDWDWSYHAFREWDGWSVEHDGPDAQHLAPSADNPRKRTLQRALQCDTKRHLKNVSQSDAELNDSAAMNATEASSAGGENGGVRVVFIGNSITLHNPYPSIGWTNTWGMAASAEDKDYVHLVTRGIEINTARRADVRVKNLAAFERNYRTWDVASGVKELVDFDPEYLIVALGENVSNLDGDDDREAYHAAFEKLVGAFFKEGRRPKTAIRGVFWPNAAKDAEMARVADGLGIPFVKADIAEKPGMKATGLFWHNGVANHPGDAGMAEIANRVLDALCGRTLLPTALK